jgi:hypothetical protein
MGMSKAVGAINHTSEVGADGRAVHSEETARLIDAEVRRLVEEAGRMAERVLIGARDALDRVADALMERETLTLADVEQIVGPRCDAAGEGAATAQRRPARPPRKSTWLCVGCSYRLCLGTSHLGSASVAVGTP